MKDCIFCKIASHEVPKEFLFEDEDVMIFPDLNPARQVHFLAVPKKHMTDFSELTDFSLMKKIFSKVQDIIKDEGLDTKGFKVFMNGGGAQVVDHLHIHITGPWGKNERMEV